MAVVDPTKSTALPKFDHRILDLSGIRFGKLTVIGFAGRSSRDLVMWRCLCDCGNETVASSNSLRNSVERSRKRSCGCLGPEATRKRSVTHGMTASITYNSWRSMRHRCVNPNATGFCNYGGRGIKVCDRWMNSFDNFLADMKERPSRLYEIDRINNDGNYEPSNCKWSTIKEQANNRRQPSASLVLTRGDKTMTIAEWSKELGISIQTIYCRRWKGWTIDKVLSGGLRR